MQLPGSQVHAKFTYIFRKTQGAVLIMTHNSGITPTGVVTDFAESKRSGLVEDVRAQRESTLRVATAQLHRSRRQSMHKAGTRPWRRSWPSPSL